MIDVKGARPEARPANGNGNGHVKDSSVSGKRLDDIAQSAFGALESATYVASFVACLPKAAYLAGSTVYHVAKRRMYGQY